MEFLNFLQVLAQVISISLNAPLPRNEYGVLGAHCPFPVWVHGDSEHPEVSDVNLSPRAPFESNFEVIDCQWTEVTCHLKSGHQVCCVWGQAMEGLNISRALDVIMCVCII